MQRKEMHFLDAEQVEWLAAATDVRYRPLILFAAYTGLRPCELVALRVWPARPASPYGSGGRSGGGGQSAGVGSSGDPRGPHHPDATLGCQWVSRSVGPISSGITSSQAVLAANEAITKLPKDQRPAPLPEGLRFYDLRHTCASLLIAQGASVKAVQAQLGHATASITLDTYGHLFPSEMEALADRLELVRDAALAKRGRTQDGPADNRLSETAGG
jgi:Phage integrase family